MFHFDSILQKMCQPLSWAGFKMYVGSYICKSVLACSCKLLFDVLLQNIVQNSFASNIQEENSRHFWAQIFCEMLPIHTIVNSFKRSCLYPVWTFLYFLYLKTFFSIASKKFEQQGHTKNKENHVILKCLTPPPIAICFFASVTWKLIKVSWVERMGRNFDHYSGFQTKKTPAFLNICKTQRCS